LNRNKGTEREERQRDISHYFVVFSFSLLFSTPRSPTFLHVPHFSLPTSYSIAAHENKRAKILARKKIFVKRMLYRSVCLLSRQAAAPTPMWIWATSSNVVIWREGKSFSVVHSLSSNRQE
jgi:hypothetical protein